jgi:predicted transposase/invertase (TIGR01784 family)
MRRDTIFYKLFQQYPSLLFQLLENPPKNADSYRFDSVAVKEPKFEIDGVFLPPENAPPGVIYFCEVQFQKDETLYERIVAESSLYFYRNRSKFSDWETVIIYPSRDIEQSNTYPMRAFLNSEQVHRIYLNELGDIHQLPTWVAMMMLTTIPEDQAPEAARYLLTKTQSKIPSSSNSVIIEMITTIMMYKFENLKRHEVESMLGITLKQTRVYQEIKEEGREEGLEQGLKAGRKEATFNLVMRLLSKRFGKISPKIRTSLADLSLPILEDLSEDLLDFKTVNDLQIWLDKVED